MKILKEFLVNFLKGFIVLFILMVIGTILVMGLIHGINMMIDEPIKGMVFIYTYFPTIAGIVYALLSLCCADEGEEDEDEEVEDETDN